MYQAPLFSPGPVEASILGELSPTFTVRFAEGEDGSLRFLEGGDGPPLILIHGHGSAATSWFSLLPALAQRFRVLAVDLPGFGNSYAPSSALPGQQMLAFSRYWRCVLISKRIAQNKRT